MSATVVAVLCRHCNLCGSVSLRRSLGFYVIASVGFANSAACSVLSFRVVLPQSGPAPLSLCSVFMSRKNCRDGDRMGGRRVTQFQATDATCAPPVRFKQRWPDNWWLHRVAESRAVAPKHTLKRHAKSHHFASQI